MRLKSDAEFEEELIFCFKNDKMNLVNFDLSTQNSQNFHFDRFLLCNVYNIWPKNYSGVILHGQWRVMQYLKNNWLVVWKMTWEIWQSTQKSPECSKASKLGLERFFYSMQKIYELTIYRGVMWHDNEEWCKICRGIDLPFQNWHHNLTPENSNVSKICTLMDSFWPNCIMFELTKVQKSMFDGTEDWCKEDKMVELNQNKNPKQLDSPDAVRKLYFTLYLII